MEELKTLKDIKSKLITKANNERLFIDSPYTLSDVLDFVLEAERQEAIRWIKHLKSQEQIFPDEQGKVIGWIKWFFNL